MPNIYKSSRDGRTRHECVMRTCISSRTRQQGADGCCELDASLDTITRQSSQYPGAWLPHRQRYWTRYYIDFKAADKASQLRPRHKKSGNDAPPLVNSCHYCNGMWLLMIYYRPAIRTGCHLHSIDRYGNEPAIQLSRNSQNGVVNVV